MCCLHKSGLLLPGWTSLGSGSGLALQFGYRDHFFYMDEKLEEHLLQDYKNKEYEEKDLKTRVWIESKKLWQVVGPAIITRIANYTMNVVTQAFAGHLGDVELASMSIANNVVLAFNFGLLLGMAIALETLCGQAFGAKSLEFWYYRILIIMTGNLKNATIAVDALSVCMSINGWEIMIPFAFLAATGVRIANELGAGNGKAAKFAAMVSLAQSTIIGIIFCAIIMIFHDQLALIFSSSPDVNRAADRLSYLLAFTILLNSVQPVLSGVAIGSGWQSLVAYVNLGSYYVIGLPLGVAMGWLFHFGVEGMWGAMIFGGTAVQTGILAIITMQRDWEKEGRKALERYDRSMIS